MSVPAQRASNSARLSAAYLTAATTAYYHHYYDLWVHTAYMYRAASLELATHLSPPSIRRPPWSAYRTLQQTSYPDPDSCSNISSMRATSHGARSSQQSSSTTLTYMVRTSFKAWGTTASISQRYPSTHQQKKILVRAQARCPLPQANPRRTHDSFSRSHSSQTPQPGARRRSPTLGVIPRWRSVDKTESKMSLHLFKRVQNLCATENKKVPCATK
jgi:hypothetical protein